MTISRSHFVFRLRKHLGTAVTTSRQHFAFRLKKHIDVDNSAVAVIMLKYAGG